MPGVNKLAATKVTRITKPGRYGDGAGLWLQVAKGGTKSWIFQFTVGGKERQLGLGSLTVVSLADARRKAKEARALVDGGSDPIAVKREKRQAAVVEKTKSITFQEAAADYISSKSPEWRNPKHREQWASTLRTYAYPIIGHLAVSDVDDDLVLKVLQPIWTTKSETAGRLRGRIERILGAAKSRHLRTGDNPARWTDHLEHSLPDLGKIKKVKHHSSMPFVEMPSFIATLRRREGMTARALEFLILTVSRTGTVIGTRDDEINFREMVWKIPASRMKTDKEHQVPLCDRAMKLLKAMPRERDNPHIFAGVKQGTHLSNMAMLGFMKHIAPDYVPHGFRSTFTDWAHETTDASHEVIEMALAHAIKDKVDAAYRRGMLLEKRRELMREWEAFLYQKGSGR